jgi:sodium transport system permease protein
MNPTFIVMRKELREMFRDKRVRNNAIVMPMFVMLLMLSLFGFIMGVTQKENQVIHVVKADNKLIQKLKAQKVKVVEVADVAEGEKLIRSGKAQLVLRFEPDFDAKLVKDLPTPITALYDPQQGRGEIGLAVVKESLKEVNQEVGEKLLRDHGLKSESLTPANIVEQKVIVGKSQTSDLIISILPYLIVMYAFYGGLGTGSDTVAGEKEKMTLETLLMAPVARSQIAIGKFLALAVVCFLSSFSALMGVVVAGLSRAPMFSKLFHDGLGLSVEQLGAMVLVLLPTVAFFASMLLAVSAFAKNPRESQSYLALISLVVLMPALFGQVIGLTDFVSQWWIRLIPVLNTSIFLRESLQGKSDPLGLMLTIGVSAILALIGIRTAVHLFNREEVLTRV